MPDALRLSRRGMTELLQADSDRHRARRRIAARRRAGRVRHRNGLWAGRGCDQRSCRGRHLRRQGSAAVQSADLPLCRCARRPSPMWWRTTPAQRLAAAFWPGPLDVWCCRADRGCRAEPAGERRAGYAGGARAGARCGAGAAARDRAGRSPRRRPTVPARSARPPRGTCWTDCPGASPRCWTAGPAAVGVESTVLDLSAAEPVLLRPGGVTVEAIEAVIGRVRAWRSDAAAGALRSPGLLASHYAPKLPVRLDAAEVRRDEALLAFGPPLPGAGALFRSERRPPI